MMSMYEIYPDVIDDILQGCGIPSDIPPVKAIRDHDYDIVLNPDEEEKNRGFNSDEENMIADFDDWG